ncbi:MAG: cupin domain-containing protein [Hymenobacter sp.]
MRLSVLGDQQCIKLTGQDTNNQFTLLEQLNSPGTGIPRHLHAKEDEVFHVQEGRVEYEVDGAVTTLGPGDLAYVPRGVAHSFRVVGSQPARVLVSIFPAGAEHMFQELAQLPAGPPDFPVVAEICGRYGITFL